MGWSSVYAIVSADKPKAAKRSTAAAWVVSAVLSAAVSSLIFRTLVGDYVAGWKPHFDLLETTIADAVLRVVELAPRRDALFYCFAKGREIVPAAFTVEKGHGLLSLDDFGVDYLVVAIDTLRKDADIRLADLSVCLHVVPH
jgi:hypothetical protein